MIYFDKDFIAFFRELEKNNNKQWFDANRQRYEKSVKKPFEKFVTDLIEVYRAEFDHKLNINPRQAIFRINRDIRFSKDKKPYKLHMGAVVCREGRKNMQDPCLYVELNAKDSRLYSGLYMINKDKLANLRNFIAANQSKFASLIQDKTFVKVFGKVQGDKNKRLPKELQAAAEKQPLIFNKNFYYYRKYKPDIILKDNLIDELVEDYKAAIKLN